MAVLTKAEWKEKLESFYPRWFFHTEENQDAFMEGIAAIFNQLDQDISDHITETFISTSNNLYLDAHGGERSIDRLSGELDSQYRIRVRNMSNKTDKAAIKDVVDQLLYVGECTILEDWDPKNYVNREAFVGRDTIIIDPIQNAFTILIDNQLHDPYTFVDREYFVDRDNHVGASIEDDYLFNIISAAVDDAKALGTLYRIIERPE